MKTLQSVCKSVFYMFIKWFTQFVFNLIPCYMWLRYLTPCGHIQYKDKNWVIKIATVLRMVRVLRTLRILKLSRYSRGLRILGTTLYRSARVLTLLVMFQIVLAITFGSFVYYLDIGRVTFISHNHVVLSSSFS